jgi:hypothetical protein
VEIMMSSEAFKLIGVSVVMAIVGASFFALGTHGISPL